MNESESSRLTNVCVVNLWGPWPSLGVPGPPLPGPDPGAGCTTETGGGKSGGGACATGSDCQTRSGAGARAGAEVGAGARAGAGAKAEAEIGAWASIEDR